MEKNTCHQALFVGAQNLEPLRLMPIRPQQDCLLLYIWRGRMKHIYTYLVLICCVLFTLATVSVAQISGEAVDYYGNTVSYEVYEELSFSKVRSNSSNQ